MTDPLRRRALGAALRAHRGALRPENFGLPATSRRRTPGLRREEVAALSGVGASWYAWLEQGRVAASAHVLGAISRSLRLDEQSQRHLMGLAGHVASCSGRSPDPVVGALRPLLDSWPTSPALALDRRFDVLAWNSAHTGVWGDPGRIDPHRRTLLWMLAGDPSVRERTDGWESLVVALAGQFRGRADRYPDDPRFAAVYELLRSAPPGRDTSWAHYGTCGFTSQRIVVDGIRLVVHMLRPTDDPDVVVLVQTPLDGTDHDAVARLVEAAT